MSEVKFNYDKLKPVLDTINSEVIKLPPDLTTKHTSVLLEIITKLMELMKTTSETFSKLEPEIKYMGSYPEGLKIVSPDEYDLFVVLKFPIQLDLDCSGLPEGYTRVRTSLADLTLLPEAHDWVDTEGNIKHAEVRRWFQSVIDNTLGELPGEGNAHKLYEYTVATCSRGPAYTLKISGGQISGIMKVDLLPSIMFPLDKLPEKLPRERYESIRKRVTFEDEYWFAVPKGPPRTCVAALKKIGWNINFQLQEKQLLNDTFNFKAAIKLIKKLRDKKKMTLCSYSIKSIFFKELEKRDFDETFWSVNSLPHVFFAMINVLHGCLKERFIPDLWFLGRNVLPRQNIDEDTFTNWINILEQVMQCAMSDPEKILDYLLTGVEKRKVVSKLQSMPKRNFSYIKRMNLANKYFTNADPTLNMILDNPILKSRYYSYENFKLAETIAGAMLNVMSRNNKLFYSLQPKITRNNFEKWTARNGSVYNVKFSMKLPSGYVLEASDKADGVTVSLPTVNKSVMPWADDDGKMSASELLTWVQHLIEQILQEDGENYIFEENYKVTKNPEDGNFVVTASHSKKLMAIKFKLLPCFVFNAVECPNIHWKVSDLLAKITLTDETFLTIPMQENEYFYMDFGCLEIQLLSLDPKIPPIIRLVERFCEKQEMKVDARCIASLILWEIERKSFKKTFWEKNCLTFLTVHLLKALNVSFKQKIVKHFWFPKENVLPEAAEVKLLNTVLMEIEEEINLDTFERYFVSEDESLALAAKDISLDGRTNSANQKREKGKRPRRRSRRRPAPKTR